MIAPLFDGRTAPDGRRDPLTPTRPADPAEPATDVPRAAPAGLPEPTRAQRYAALRRHGDFTLAYSTAAQPGLRHFGDERGYLAYESKWGYTFALGDPVAAPDRRAELVREFVAAVRKPVFVQCSAETAGTLDGLGWYANGMGVDTTLDLRGYDFRGKKKEWLRYAANWCERRDYRVEEPPAGAWPLDELADVSRRWKATRSVSDREVRFLNRPLTLAPDALAAEPAGGRDVRPFLLRDADGAAVAFVMFDPLYRDGRVIGYVTCFKRRAPEAPSYGEAAVMKAAIDRFGEEGRERLNLGLSPLAGIRDDRFRVNPLVRRSLTLGYEAGWVNRLYPVRGHADYKRRFRGEEFETYYASPVLWNLTRIAALMRLSGVL